VPAINFDFEATDWSASGITDQASFEAFIGSPVANFSLVNNGSLRCSILNGTIVDLGGSGIITKINVLDLPLLNILRVEENQLTTVPDFSFPLLNELRLGNNQLTSVPDFSGLPLLNNLYLQNNQLTSVLDFSNLPLLEDLNLSGNQLTLASYTTAETWANLLTTFANVCQIDFSNNIDSISGTNLETILISKNCNVIA
jgi:Leucine-rich repeat (LRR) protein